MDTKIISDRAQNAFYPECPVQLVQNRITEEGDTRFLTIGAVSTCGIAPLRVHLSVAFMDARRADLPGTEGNITVLSNQAEATERIPCPPNAVYATSIPEAVYNGTELLWERKDRAPLVLPEGEILWQTDPLYAQIRRECEGIVQPVYKPATDAENGLWRCTCGQLQLQSASVCGRCGVEKSWLDTHFDPGYLQKRNAEYEVEKAKHPAKKIRQAHTKEATDRLHMLLLLGAVLLLIAGIVAFFLWIRPTIRYDAAMRHVQDGEYDAAIEEFDALGDFRDAAQQAKEATLAKARFMTGLEDVYYTTSHASPWFSITEDGTLSFRKDSYTGNWEEFVVPDMVDGIIVRSLDKNFFLNCKDMERAVLSDCLEELGEQTFFNCYALKEVVFGKNLSTLGARTFINCTSLETITIPDQITSIGLRMFNSCTALRVVHMGKGITEVPSYAFSCCTALERVSFSSQLTAIGEYAFSECDNLTKIYYPGTAADFASVPRGDNNTILDTVMVIEER